MEDIGIPLGIGISPEMTSRILLSRKKNPFQVNVDAPLLNSRPQKKDKNFLLHQLMSIFHLWSLCTKFIYSFALFVFYSIKRYIYTSLKIERQDQTESLKRNLRLFLSQLWITQDNLPESDESDIDYAPSESSCTESSEEEVESDDENCDAELCQDIIRLLKDSNENDLDSKYLMGETLGLLDTKSLGLRTRSKSVQSRLSIHFISLQDYVLFVRVHLEI